jgi:hypothetical protein
MPKKDIYLKNIWLLKKCDYICGIKKIKNDHKIEQYDVYDV